MKTFTQKAKQANKSRDIGGGVMQSIQLHTVYANTSYRLGGVRLKVRKT